MDLNKLTLGEIAAIVTSSGAAPVASANLGTPVIICTDKRAVVFGYTDNHSGPSVTLKNARMALYWSADVGGVFGLSEVGPTKDCKISAPTESVILHGVTAVFSVSDKAEKAWNKAPVQGRK